MIGFHLTGCYNKISAMVKKFSSGFYHSGKITSKSPLKYFNYNEILQFKNGVTVKYKSFFLWLLLLIRVKDIIFIRIIIEYLDNFLYDLEISSIQ